MELDINKMESCSTDELRKLRREKGLKIPMYCPKLEYQIDLKAWEVVPRMQAALQEQAEEDYFATLENAEPWFHLTLELGIQEGDGPESDEKEEENDFSGAAEERGQTTEREYC
ncbi:hypothetical protein NDU88_005470 [Pleurodeles waltl]|uniref:Uncharacterized protein n=1 Tax=Pleurodeles waltl TaxID=8319 RepID=A0AAV7SLP8_PLEWA|nr:hypothetical protein NDU88_005470 [Pleurodeles waltl]